MQETITSGIDLSEESFYPTAPGIFQIEVGSGTNFFDMPDPTNDFNGTSITIGIPNDIEVKLRDGSGGGIYDRSLVNIIVLTKGTYLFKSINGAWYQI